MPLWALSLVSYLYPCSLARTSGDATTGRASRTGYLLYKAHPESPDNIGAAYAAVMAWKARLDAVSAGLGARRKKAVMGRIRGGALG
jgi:hypothetical protein